jgi:hypothetical protein
MEYWSRRGSEALAVKGINFEGMVLSDYKGYGNELLKMLLSMPCKDCIKTLRAHDFWVKKYEEISNWGFKNNEEVEFRIWIWLFEMTAFWIIMRNKVYI